MTYVYCVILVNLVACEVAAKIESSRVIMVEVPGITWTNEMLYEAIRAQLTATSVQLERLMVDSPLDLNDASKLAETHVARMLFWVVKKGTISTIFYYKRDSHFEIRTRTLDLTSESPPNRLDTIGNAVCSIVEEPVLSQRETFRHRTPKPLTPPPPPQQSTDRYKRLNLFIAYAGSYFADSSVTHGAGLGLNILPTPWFALSLSYVHGMLLRKDNEKYQLTLRSRIIEGAAAGVLFLRFVQLHMGLAWSIDIRSYAIKSGSESISPRRGQTHGIHSLVPKITAIWPISDMFGIMTELGAAITLNKKVYKILRDDESEIVVMAPFRTKLIYKVGFVVRL